MEKPSTSKDPSAIDYVPPENLGITIMDDATTTEETLQRIEHVEMERNKEPDLGERNSRDPFESSNVDAANTASQGTVVENTAAEKSNEVVEILEEPQAETMLENVYYIKVQNIEITQPCMVCHGIKVVKYNCHYNGAKTYICCDDCLFQFQASNTNIQLHEYFTKFYSPVQIDGSYKYARQCKQCACYLKAATGILSWEAMDFCKESCLYRYQSQMKFQCCAECGNEVIYKQLGKYAVRFGKMVRQFCSGKCLEDRKRKIKICSYCQKSVPLPKTTVGNKYFCHDICKGRYEHLQLPKKPPFLINRLDACCFVCKSTKPIQMEFDYHRSPFYFCSINCVTIFKFVQNCDPPPKKCHNCSKFVLQQYMERYALHYDNFVHYFCSEICQYIYIITHRRVIACIWCKVKKYNFDMIQKNNYLESTIFICSLYCLNSLKKSVNTVVSKRKTCFNCGQEVGVYNIKLADGQLQSFCSNHCISLYQSQFVTAQTQIQPKRTRGRTKQILPDKPGPLPIITSVCSLAPTAAKAKGAEITIKKLIVIVPSEAPDVRNVCLQVGQITFDKETQDNVECDSQEVQTNIPENGPKIIPIPVPIYIPFPMFSFRAPFPIPVPFPVVIPCPILIPLSKHTSANIMKEIKKEQVKAPSDPFEAELLMMAEIIADEEKEVSAEVESADDDEDDAAERPEYSPEQPDASTPFGEDMLQMALKMASDFEEPPVDLEGALAASTIAASQAHNIETANEEVSDSPNVTPKVSGRGRGRGRPRGTRQNPSRRGRRQANVSVPVPEPTSPAEPMEPVEKPDANMCLKYTFGVNAWKQWVITKNTELERSSRRLKTFKTELLQLTSDELNYSLCLFVKEVRKPNGTEYAPDTIYYLCLGIQQYLYENGRIDNIFCDSYYEKFTDCLDEICQKFSNLYNDSHYIVTRVEEEHLWESKQLGAHSPHVLLSTLMFFNTKHFNLKNVDEHMQLSFSHIMKHWKRNPNQPFVVKQAPSRNVLLRFYPPQSSFESGNRKKKVYEQQENEENPLRCPVKLYEFYLSKCPESVKTRNDVFYLLPERSCVPDSPVWYSTTALDKMALEKMLHRVKMVKEINVALLTN